MQLGFKGAVVLDVESRKAIFVSQRQREDADTSQEIKAQFGNFSGRGTFGFDCKDTKFPSSTFVSGALCLRQFADDSLAGRRDVGESSGHL